MLLLWSPLHIHTACSAYSAGFSVERVMGLLSMLWSYLPQLVSILPTVLHINCHILAMKNVIPTSIAVIPPASECTLCK